MFNSKNEIHEALKAVLSGHNLHTVDRYGDFGSAFKSLTGTMNSAPSDIAPATLCNDLIADLIVMQSYINRYGQVEKKNGKVILPRETERDFFNKKSKMFDDLIKKVAETQI